MLNKRVAMTVCFGLALLSISSSAVWGQTAGSGSVGGTVTDPSGAVVVDAQVTLTDASTNAQRTATSNEAGRYLFPNVPPGTYSMTTTKEGFRVAKVSSLTVNVGTTLTVDVAMELGTVSQTVEVIATTSELQVTNSTIGNTVSGDMLQSLPSLGRDVSSFVTMQPGVSPDGSVAGTVVDQAVFMLDGGNNSNDMDGSGGVYNAAFGDDPAGGLFSNQNNPITSRSVGLNGGQPSGVMPTPVDSVEEFKVATANQTADFNNSSGMEVSLVTKRGANSWHGSVYEYYLDNNFSGNTWENNQTGTPVPDWHRSWFGAAAGGPLIPKDILGGKTYIFANYQGARYPNSETFNRLVPSADMRNGFLTDPSLAGQPGCDANGRCDLKAMDPRHIGINPYVQQMWNTYMPAGIPGQCGPFSGDGYCDGVNTLLYRANLSIPQNDNFGVVRIDHDFGPKWHFMSSYRYYHSENATDSQVDIGGALSGDTLGTPKSTSNRPQVPWYLVVGMTTSISAHVTNDFRYSFLRNWWQWASSGDPAQPFSGLPAPAGALEPFGESAGHLEALTPYNVNTQQTRTRFWDGKDHFFRDDVSMLKGSHLVQFGGQYQHNWNYHQRTDNGVGINYYPVYQLGDSSGSGNVNLSLISPTIQANPTLAREAAAVLGIVTDAQQAYIRSGNNLTLNPPLTAAFDKTTIPYYNLYFNDTWHMKPSLTVTYGLGWTLEMPPVEATGKQVVLVDAKGQPIDTASYLAQRQGAALKGQVFNPQIGFALLPNVAGHPKYPFDPFYHGFSPRIAVAWNPDLGPALGGKRTVFRGGYGRIYGRVNGVNLVLTPLLSPGIIQAVSCSNILNTPSCDPTAKPNANTAFRIGTDGTTVPLPAAQPTLPQPFFPGIGGNAEANGASPLDPHFRPSSVDSFDLTIQHQISGKMSAEVGVISRWVHNELLNININTVPYMMTLGGQTFASAYAAVERAMGCATSQAMCQAATAATTMVAPQPFFETALAGTGYCTPGNCTATVVSKEFVNFQSQNVWTLWSDLDNGSTAPGFNFPFSMMNTGPNAQISSNVTPSTSFGHGNYNGAFVTFRMNDWHGVTLQNNFTWSKALGTGSYVQATSGLTAVDPFDIDRQYGPQVFDRKFVDTMFLVYQLPFYQSQRGLLGHVLGGWTFSPVFTAGSGAPLFCVDNSGVPFEGYSGAQEFGAADNIFINTDANCLQTTKYTGGASVHYLADGTANIFANPSAVFNTLRPPILGIDNRTGGLGQFRGLPYWNMNLGIKKNFRVRERFSADASANFVNVLNHNQLLDPILSLQSPASFGQLSTEGTLPRTLEFGIRVSF